MFVSDWFDYRVRTDLCLTMAIGEGSRSERGRGGGRGAALRQSRRQQGLPPDEVADLDAIQKAARKANAEQRKTAILEKEAAAEGQPAPEPPVQEDAHQATLDGHSHGEVEPEGKSGLDEPVKTSEGSAEEDESQSESGDSGSSSASEDDSDELAALEDKPLRRRCRRRCPVKIPKTRRAWM
jgi:hypothetical protein